MSIAAEIISAVRADALLADGRPVVVLLSGGRDSTCLLDVAARVAGAGSVTALHVNYGLREAAGEDEQHCAAICRELGARLHVERPQRPQSGNVQAWAREVRYAAAARLAAAAGADIAAGHTATDQVETILYRLASSPSRRALLGMKRRDGQLVRPLLSFTREQTSAYCLERGLSWRDDESNETLKYARGRVRNQLLPALRDVHPGAETNLLMLAEILRDEHAALDDIVNDVLGTRGEISLARLARLPVGISRLVVQRLADAVYSRPAPGTARRLDEILALRRTGTAHIDLPHGVRATAQDGILRMTPTDAKHP